MTWCQFVNITSPKCRQFFLLSKLITSTISLAGWLIQLVSTQNLKGRRNEMVLNLYTLSMPSHVTVTILVATIFVFVFRISVVKIRSFFGTPPTFPLEELFFQWHSIQWPLYKPNKEASNWVKIVGKVCRWIQDGGLWWRGSNTSSIRDP